MDVTSGNEAAGGSPGGVIRANIEDLLGLSRMRGMSMDSERDDAPKSDSTFPYDYG